MKISFLTFVSHVVKDQHGSFSLSKRQNYPATSAKWNNYLRCQYTASILCLTMTLWDSSRNRETHGKNVRLAGLFDKYHCSGAVFEVFYGSQILVTVANLERQAS